MNNVQLYDVEEIKTVEHPKSYTRKRSEHVVPELTVEHPESDAQKQSVVPKLTVSRPTQVHSHVMTHTNDEDRNDDLVIISSFGFIIAWIGLFLMAITRTTNNNNYMYATFILFFISTVGALVFYHRKKFSCFRSYVEFQDENDVVNV